MLPIKISAYKFNLQLMKSANETLQTMQFIEVMKMPPLESGGNNVGAMLIFPLSPMWTTYFQPLLWLFLPQVSAEFWTQQKKNICLFS